MRWCSDVSMTVSPHRPTVHACVHTTEFGSVSSWGEQVESSLAIYPCDFWHFIAEREGSIGFDFRETLSRVDRQKRSCFALAVLATTPSVVQVDYLAEFHRAQFPSYGSDETLSATVATHCVLSRS